MFVSDNCKESAGTAVIVEKNKNKSANTDLFLGAVIFMYSKFFKRTAVFSGAYLLMRNCKQSADITVNEQ